jgi:abelson tyrosine-protein kinase 1
MGNLQIHFNVYAAPEIGKPWGAFTTDTVAPELDALYDEVGCTIPVQDSKVSNHGNPWDAVLLARLRFKPDVLEPTSN